MQAGEATAPINFETFYIPCTPSVCCATSGCSTLHGPKAWGERDKSRSQGSGCPTESTACCMNLSQLAEYNGQTPICEGRLQSLPIGTTAIGVDGSVDSRSSWWHCCSLRLYHLA
eukprot:2481815-Amphidinium_carterae.1